MPYISKIDHDGAQISLSYHFSAAGGGRTDAHLQILGWGGERTKHESVQWRVLIIETDDERESEQLLRRVSWLCTMMVTKEMCGSV